MLGRWILVVDHFTEIRHRVKFLLGHNVRAQSINSINRALEVGRGAAESEHPTLDGIRGKFYASSVHESPEMADGPKDRVCL